MTADQCRHDGTERSRITWLTDKTTGERLVSVQCCACGHVSKGQAEVELVSGGQGRTGAELAKDAVVLLAILVIGAGLGALILTFCR